MSHPQPHRRALLATLAAGASGFAAWQSGLESPAKSGMARIAISLDLEMSRNFPRWEDTHWDYEKGNLDETSKRCTTAVCDMVRSAGGVAHLFVLGRMFEQADVDWLLRLVRQGHPVGNHTYDHVNITGRRLEELQYRFNRAPWLVEGKTPEQVIRDNIRLTTAAIETRLGVKPAGFRTPGGFPGGLADRPDVRGWLKEAGFTWVSARYPTHPAAAAGIEPDARFIAALVAAQEQAQPFTYPDGLVEVPMSPISDIGAFRTGRWKLPWFIRATRACLEAVIDKGQCFDFLGHPSCLGVIDPGLDTIRMILEVVEKNRHRATLVGLDALAGQAKPARKG